MWDTVRERGRRVRGDSIERARGTLSGTLLVGII
jgi:hypothetical protein